MTNVILFQNKCGCYQWKVITRNGREIAHGPQYLTKFHCKEKAEWLFPTFEIVDQTKDGRRRG